MRPSKGEKINTRHSVRLEGSKCVWKLDCPYCGWVFGYVIDFTGVIIDENMIFIANGDERKPDHFPKILAGHVFAELHVTDRECKRCGSLCLREDEISKWLSKHGVLSPIDLDYIENRLDTVDPNGLIAVIHSDRIYDYQFQEWGVDPYPSQYVFIRNENEFLKMLSASIYHI
jgi:hypothetical protein